MNQPLKVAIAGLGTVGAGTVKLLRDNAAAISLRAGRDIRIVAISARDRAKDRGFKPAGEAWFDDPVQMAKTIEADVIVELIGGADGPAKAAVEAAIARKKHVVTANKALLAHHGAALATAAEAAGVSLMFEAAVAGGIPIIKTLREGLAANVISRVYGILNGTCNYILTEMRNTKRDFADVLTEAQSLGYAEKPDPGLDIDGVDAAHKLAVLASVAFGTAVDFGAVHVEGIRQIGALDMEYAEQLGYRIKLVGLAARQGRAIEQRVYPCMMAPTAPLATVDGVFNAVVAEGDAVGRVALSGRGAGAGPTASAVVADLIDVASGRRTPAFGVPAARLERAATLPISKRVGAYYVRLVVVDRPGVFADIATAFRDESVSMETVVQRGRNSGANVNVVIITHDTEEAALTKALAKLQTNAAVVEPPHMIRIESF